MGNTNTKCKECNTVHTPRTSIIVARRRGRKNNWEYEQVGEHVPVYECMQFGDGEFIEDGNFLIFIAVEWEYMAVVKHIQGLCKSIKGTDESVLNELYSKYHSSEEKLDGEEI